MGEREGQERERGEREGKTHHSAVDREVFDKLCDMTNNKRDTPCEWRAEILFALSLSLSIYLSIYLPTSLPSLPPSLSLSLSLSLPSPFYIISLSATSLSLSLGYLAPFLPSRPLLPLSRSASLEPHHCLVYISFSPPRGPLPTHLFAPFLSIFICVTPPIV